MRVVDDGLLVGRQHGHCAARNHTLWPSMAAGNGDGDMANSNRIGNVLYPVSDVSAATAFYGEALGLAVKFRDGERFAALDGGGVTLAIAGAEEDVTGGRPAASFKVEDVVETVGKLVEAGAKVVRDPEEGPHEVRAVVEDLWGNLVVVYSARR
ncbi:VOC family protein [Streptomyces spiralis]|uniref:VOC family protein n=1 Tax=Streptomyces spiralis TaxID=66376 RepID=UPI0033F282E0